MQIMPFDRTMGAVQNDDNNLHPIDMVVGEDGTIIRPQDPAYGGAGPNIVVLGMPATSGFDSKTILIGCGILAGALLLLGGKGK